MDRDFFNFFMEEKENRSNCLKHSWVFREREKETGRKKKYGIRNMKEIFSG